MTRTAIHPGTLDRSPTVTPASSTSGALEARAEPPARSGYGDMPRPLKELDTDRFRATTPRPRMLGPLAIALTLLDL